MINNEKILSSVKHSIGITDDYDHFDDIVTMNINTALATLYQLGIGPASGFQVTTGDETWEDFFGDNPKLNLVKSYVCLSVKLLFDPPAAGTLLDAIHRQLDELTWRINVAVDPEEA